MFTREFITVFIGATTLSFILAACGSELIEFDRVSSDPDGATPACTQYPGSAVDPCERRDSWIVRVYPIAGQFASVRAPELPIDVESRHRDFWYRGGAAGGLKTPQIVVRGVVIPDSARCTKSLATVYGLDTDVLRAADAEKIREVCFVDVSSREFIVGRGPRTLPIVVGWRNSVSTSELGYGTPAYYDDIVEPIRKMMEGYEFVFVLARPPNMAWGEWGPVDVWDVQRRSDGTVVAQHELYHFVGSMATRRDFEYDLTELDRLIREAHATLSAEFNGRIGEDADSPKLVTDASRKFLLAQLRELGAYDFPGVTPMPAPAAALPAPPTNLWVQYWPEPAPEVDIAWTAPADSDVTAYKIVRVDDLGNEVVIAEALPGQFVEVTDQDLPVLGAVYTYTVVAINAYGESAPSNADSVWHGELDAPTGLWVTLQPMNEADLEWEELADKTDAKGYRLQRKVGDDGEWETRQHHIPLEFPSISDRPLQSGTTYHYRVIAYNDWSEGPPSATATQSVP